MAQTRLYIARHGKTMFNTIGRAQGWSDTPLTLDGENGIRELGVGLKDSGLEFKQAFSSDSGRTIQTMGIILEEANHQGIPYRYDKRIREWCFGSLDGGYNGELFQGVLPRTAAFRDGQEVFLASYEEIANSIVEVDTANWAEPWSVLSDRILSGFTDMAKEIEASGGGNAIIVSHGMTIGTLLWLIDHHQEKAMIDNGSMTVLLYENGQFTIEKVADMSYRLKGRELIAKENE